MEIADPSLGRTFASAVWSRVIWFLLGMSAIVSERDQLVKFAVRRRHSLPIMDVNFGSSRNQPEMIERAST